MLDVPFHCWMENAMRVTIVEKLNGVPHIRWIAAIVLASALGLLTSATTAGGYFMLTCTFSPLAAMFGFMGGIIVVGSGIVRSLKHA